jgi:hypothetical protein
MQLSTARSAFALCAMSASAADIRDLADRIGRRLDEEELRILPDRLFPRFQVREIDPRGLDAEFGEDLVEERHHGAEHAARRDEMVALLEQPENRGGHGRHSGGGRHARLRAFHGGQAILEHLHRGVGEARIDVARLFVGELARGFGGGLVDEAGGEDQRLRVLLEIAADGAGTNPERVGLELACHGGQSTRDRPRSSW